jgi:hypothetical protein
MVSGTGAKGNRRREERAIRLSWRAG